MMHGRTFTREEADRLLDWLEATFLKIDPYQQETVRQRSRAAEIQRAQRGNGSTALQAELQRALQLIGELEKGVNDIVGQIASRGVIVKDVEQGLVDFPSVREGRQVYLCWRRGEPSVQHWHEVDAGFAGRQPL